MALPESFDTPGIYVEVEDGPAGTADPNKRALLIGYKDPAYPGETNVPYRPTSLSDARNKLGPKSLLFAMYAAALSQLPFGQGAEISVLPVPEPAAGVKHQSTLKFLAAPVAGVLGANVAAQAGGICRLYVGRRGGDFSFDKDDTFATIATKAKAMLDAVEDLPVTVSIATDTLTFTDFHKGEQGKDMPVSCTFLTDDTGVAASPGTLTFAGGPAAAGTATLKSHSQIRTIAIAAASTDAASATAVRDDLNASSFPVSAAIASPATGVVTLFFRNDRVVYRLGEQETGIAPQTLVGAFGTAGSGVPVLTAALLSLTAEIGTGYKAWAHPFVDSATLTTLVNHILVEADVIRGKGQTMFSTLAYPLADYAAAPVVDATTPKLSTTDRARFVWSQGCVLRPCEISARVAAAVAAADRQFQNFNFLQLRTDEFTPFGYPARADLPGVMEVEQAIDYGLAPASTQSAGQPADINAEGLYKVMDARTTYKPKGSVDKKRMKWSAAHIIDYLNLTLKAFLFGAFYDKSIKFLGLPRTDGTVIADSIRNAVFTWLLEMYDLDLVNDPRAIKDAISVALISPTKFRVKLPYSIVADLDQIRVSAQLQ